VTDHLGAAAQAPPGPGASVLALARRAAALPGQAPALLARAARLAERLEAERYHIAVLGDFKRGKSTLINALIGHPVLPAGVIPVTTVATEVRFGSRTDGVTVAFDDGRRVEIRPADIGEYACERGNPANARGVRRVEVAVTTSLGAHGVVLVDTPGVASVNAHQTAVARSVLEECDGAVLVLSVDSPLSESEQALLAELAGRGGQLFVVVNKCDHLSPAELEEVRAYLTAHLERLLGTPVIPAFVSARTALDAAVTASDGRDPPEPGFAAFRQALVGFVRDGLTAARQTAAAAELARLAARLSAAVEVERAAAVLDLDTLGVQVRRFEAAASQVRRLFDGDCAVLEHEAGDLAGSIGRRLAEHAARASDEQWSGVVAAVGSRRGRALDRALDDAVDTAVRAAFEPIRYDVLRFADDSWAALADRFARGVRARVLELQAAADELFHVHLPEAPMPVVHEERERFSYLFVRAESPGSSAIRVLEALLPGDRARRRMLRRAQQRLAGELDKHAGRARWDLVQRLDAARHQFVAAMTAELDETETSLLAAARGARSSLQASQEEHAERERVHRDVVTLVRDVRALAALHPGPASPSAPTVRRRVPAGGQ
jgi:small GTP-binding protein